MALRKSLSPDAKFKVYSFHEKPLHSDCAAYSFHTQRAPPLSLLQYARAFAPIPDAPTWQANGIYQSPAFHLYMSPQIRRAPRTPTVKPWIYAYRHKYSIPSYTLKNYKDKKPKLPEPLWHPTGPYESKRPTSLSPEKRIEKLVEEPLWRPTGRLQHTNVPYFDPPSLRWSLQTLLKSTPDLHSKLPHLCRSSSAKIR